MVTFKEANELFHAPFMDLLYKAQTVHRENFDTTKMQVCTLLSIQTGGCPEDCAYCAQSKRNKNRSPIERITDIDEIVLRAKEAKETGATRFCLGASGRRPSPELMDIVCRAIPEIKNSD